MDIAKQRNFLLQEIKIDKPGLPNQNNEEFTGLDEFYEDHPNLDFKEIIRKVNNVGYTFSNNSYYDGNIDLEKKNGEESYYGYINDDGYITIFGVGGETIETI